MKSVLEKLENRSARVGVVGLGYVGLPFALEAAQAGYRVTGIERNPERVAKVNRGENYIDDIREEDLAREVEAGRLRAQTGFDGVEDLDALVIAVPTPLDKNLVPDLQYVRHVTEELARRLRPGQLVSLESTTYPGTTEEVMQPILEGSGLKADRDFYLAHSPERVDPYPEWKALVGYDQGRVLRKALQSSGAGYQPAPPFFMGPYGTAKANKQGEACVYCR